MIGWWLLRGFPGSKQKTGSQLRTLVEIPEQMIQWMRSNWEQAGGVARGLFGYVCRALVSSW